MKMFGRRLLGLFFALLFLQGFIFGTVSGGQIQLDRPKAEPLLPNPLVMRVPRDEVLRAARQMFETRQIPLDQEDCNENTGECVVISRPVIFIRGIATRRQLEHYCEVPNAHLRNWIRGRYVLRIQVTPASPDSSLVGVHAKIEGFADGGTGAEWVQLNSRGELEDGFLRCLQERALGGECKDERN